MKHNNRKGLTNIRSPHISNQSSNLIWIHLRKDRFPSHIKSKLAPRVHGLVELFEKIEDNAYKVDLPNEYGFVSTTFNVGDRSP